MRFGSLFAGIGGMCYSPPMPRGGKPKQYPLKTVARVKALYAKGHTQSEVATILGLTQKIIWRLMYRHSIPTRVAAKRDQRGEKNHMWKGGVASYTAFHSRMQALKGRPKKCEVCQTEDPSKHYDWANLTGKYDDPDDYKRMCRSCHWKHDQTYLNFTENSRPNKRKLLNASR